MQITRSTVKALLLGENTTFSKRLLLASIVLAVAVFIEIMIRDNSSHSIVASQSGPLYLAAFIGLASAYNAYVNKGVLVSLAVVVIPAFGYMSTGVLLGYVGNMPPWYERHIISPAALSVIYGSMIASVAYVSGALLRHFKRIGTRWLDTRDDPTV